MNLAAVLAQGISMALFALGALVFAGLLRGSLYLRRAAREGLQLDPVMVPQSPLAPGISILTAPRDASLESRDFVRRLFALEYRHQVVLVLNGRAAGDGPVWRNAFSGQDPQRFLVVERPDGPLGEALQAGAEMAAVPLIGWVDRGGEFEPDLLSRLAVPMLEEPATVGVWSWSLVAPSGRWFGRYAALESLRHWLTGCATQVPVPGSAMLIRKDSLLAAGGFHEWPGGVFRRLKGRVAYAPATSYRLRTPSSWSELRKMAGRDRRWFPAALETAVYPLAAAGWWLGWIDSALAGVVLLTTVGIGIVNSMGAVVLWEFTGGPDCTPQRMATLFLAAIPENLGYRQVRNLWLIATVFSPAGIEKS